MILADKIINERKKNGWSQEELAEKLSVSRQSVSKWESAQAIPDMKKIIKMSELFNVSTDYLLKDEIEADDISGVISEEKPGDDVIRVSIEEANGFLNTVKSNMKMFTSAIALCIMSPVTLIFLAGLSEVENSFVSENLAGMIGLIVLFLMVACAVYMFIVYDSRMKQYEYLNSEIIETEYGVSGMVKEKKKDYASKYTGNIALGVVLCIVSVIPLLSVGMLELDDFIVITMLCVMFVLITSGTVLIVAAVVTNSSYDKLLQENEFSKDSKIIKKKGNNTLGTCYWLVVTATYLAWSFISRDWHITWIVWPVAAVLYGVFDTIVQLIGNKEK